LEKRKKKKEKKKERKKGRKKEKKNRMFLQQYENDISNEFVFRYYDINMVYERNLRR
jgi:hypothetical protein